MFSQIDQQMKKELGLAFNTITIITNITDNAINAIDDGINAIDDVINELAEIDVDEDIVNVKDYVEDHKDSKLPLSENFNASEQSFSSAKFSSKVQNSLNDLLQDCE